MASSRNDNIKKINDNGAKKVNSRTVFLSFELTMPNKGSWNGKWSGENNKYYLIKKISKKFFDKIVHFKELSNKGSNSCFYYNFGDGWVANVRVEIIDNDEAKKRTKISKGFCGYEWMVDSIINNGSIMVK